MNQKPERNDPCPCKSGKKYKKCCGRPGLAKHDVTYVGNQGSLISRIQKISGVASAPARSLKDRIGHLGSPPKEENSSSGLPPKEPHDFTPQDSPVNPETKE